MKLSRIWFCLMIFLLFGMITTANALTIDTQTNYLVQHLESDEGSSSTIVIDASDSDSDNGHAGTISSTVSNSFWGISGNASGDDNGNIAADTEWLAPDNQNFAANATVTWSEKFTAATAGSYDWDFTITGGQLGWTSNSSATDMTAEYSIKIYLDATQIWYSSAIFGADSTYANTYATSGTVLNGVSASGYDSNREVNAHTYTYNEQSYSENLGSFEAGDEIQLSYVLSVSASGTGGETGSWAFIGDPGNLSTGAGITGSLQGGGQTTPPVPEPATVLLFGIGLLGLAGVNRRKK